MPPRRNVDLALGAVSRSADGGRLWLAIALGLVATRRRFARRAALRGFVSLVAAEALGNGVLKPLARRSRPGSRAPLAAAVARPREPRTSSFPSTHTAAGAAFAAGAAMEVPALGVPLGLAAGAVGWSRVRTRRHHRSDVVAGAALGVAAAVASRRLWPVAPRAAAAVGRAAGRAGSVATDAAVHVVVNQASGPAIGRDAGAAIERALPRARVDVVDGDDVPASLEAAARSADVVGVCGGDGTVGAAAAAAHSSGRALLVLPGGTLNHFARAAGVETIDDAARALADGAVAEVDLARIADRPFLNAASLGAYADLVHARERLEDRIGKWPALVVALVRVLPRARPLVVEIDGERRSLWMAFFGNCRYHPAGFAPTWRERLDDGELDVRLVDATEAWSRVRLVAAVLTGRLGRCRAYEARTARRVEVRVHGGRPRLAADGEVFDGPSAFTVEKLERPLHVVVAAG